MTLILKEDYLIVGSENLYTIGQVMKLNKTEKENGEYKTSYAMGKIIGFSTKEEYLTQFNEEQKENILKHIPNKIATAFYYKVQVD